MVKNRSTTPPSNPFQAYKCLDNKGFYMKTTPSKKNDKPSSLSDGIGKDSLLKPKKPLLVRLNLLLLQTLECRELLIHASENVSASRLPARSETTTSWPNDLQQVVSQQLEAVQHCIQALRPKFHPACWQPLLELILESVSPDPRHREVGPPSTTTHASDSVPVPSPLSKSRTKTPHFPPKMPPRDFFTSPRLPSPSFLARYKPPLSLSPGNLFRWIRSVIQHLQFTAWDFWNNCTQHDNLLLFLSLALGPNGNGTLLPETPHFSFPAGGD
jgi:hypothetical protein